MTVSPKLAPMLAFALLLAPAMASCGGDTRRAETEATEARTTGAGGPVIATKVTDPARRAYVGRIDAICRRFDPERSKAEERVGESVRPEEASRAYDGTIALGWRELRQIEAIPPPPGDHKLLRANVFGPIRRQLAIRQQISTALSETAVPQLRRLRAELDNLSRALGGFARGYGFQVCGKE